ncbi:MULTISPECIES: PLDc N-terminal domain-containing protein [unclassified Rhodococcus (in: high G+C Gram-positive bacteria)]|uniref:PLDc N-terminal domain-containing protein n=1 Tax=unclassified Rhodococcus (in: high G+C Gram-positive bacteria) TaxID=192944 RepID=UPI00036DF74C|nr:PLDc N-terminal domain-containing protein [Rhodococcus sp. DK17]
MSPWKRPVTWSRLTASQRAALVVMAAVQVGLAAAAWADLAKRDPHEIRGSRTTWAAAIAVNFIGPIAYFRWARRAPAQAR